MPKVLHPRIVYRGPLIPPEVMEDISVPQDIPSREELRSCEEKL